MYDDDGGGCLESLFGMMLFVALFGALKWIGIGAVVIAVIALVVFVAKLISTRLEKSEMERAEREAEKEQEEEQRSIDEERRKIEEKRARIAAEKASYNSYIQALDVNRYQDREKLREATILIEKMADDTSEAHKPKIVAFFDRYLPLMTETLNNAARNNIDIDESIEIFSETVRNFAASLYHAESMVETNKEVLKGLAIRDGYYDPYNVNFSSEEKDNS